MKTSNIILFTDEVMNDDLASTGVPLFSVYGYAVQAVYSATPTGSLKLQCSSDPFSYANGVVIQPTNWVDIADSSFSITGAGIYTWNVNGAMYNFVRLVYTDASSGMSTAELNAVINVKGV